MSTQTKHSKGYGSVESDFLQAQAKLTSLLETALCLNDSEIDIGADARLQLSAKGAEATGLLNETFYTMVDMYEDLKSVRQRERANGGGS